MVVDGWVRGGMSHTNYRPSLRPMLKSPTVQHDAEHVERCSDSAVAEAGAAPPQYFKRFPAAGVNNGGKK